MPRISLPQYATVILDARGILRSADLVSKTCGKSVESYPVAL